MPPPVPLPVEAGVTTDPVLGLTVVPDDVVTFGAIAAGVVPGMTGIAGVVDPLVVRFTPGVCPNVESGVAAGGVVVRGKLFGIVKPGAPDVVEPLVAIVKFGMVGFITVGVGAAGAAGATLGSAGSAPPPRNGLVEVIVAIYLL